jgi:hypothetical protein
MRKIIISSHLHQSGLTYGKAFSALIDPPISFPLMSWHNPVSVMTGYGLDDQMIKGLIPGWGWESLSSPPCPDQLWGPPIFLSNGYQGLFSRGEADHSTPSSAEVVECLDLYLLSPNVLSWHGAQLKHRDNFTFIFKFLSCICVHSFYIFPHLVTIMVMI